MKPSERWSDDARMLAKVHDPAAAYCEEAARDLRGLERVLEQIASQTGEPWVRSLARRALTK